MGTVDKCERSECSQTLAHGNSRLVREGRVFPNSRAWEQQTSEIEASVPKQSRMGTADECSQTLAPETDEEGKQRAESMERSNAASQKEILTAYHFQSAIIINIIWYI